MNRWIWARHAAWATAVAVLLGAVVVGAPRAAAAELIDPSKDIPLIPGQKLKGNPGDRIFRPYTIQRLTERAYWVESVFLDSTFFVGDKGVMVIDPLSNGRGHLLLQAIAEVTPLPVTTLVYSHYQIDHVGDAQVFVDEAASRGGKLEILATHAAVEEINRYGNRVPLPTKALKVPYDHFMFETFRVDVHTPPSGHSPDNSLVLLVSDKVLHATDNVGPDWLPFASFFAAQEVRGYENSLRLMLRLDWNILTAGHGNIGAKADVELVLDYVTDMRAAVEEAVSSIDPGQFVQPGVHLFNWVLDFREAVIDQVVERLRPEWGDREEFELVVRSHIEMVFTEYVLRMVPTF